MKQIYQRAGETVRQRLLRKQGARLLGTRWSSLLEVFYFECEEQGYIGQRVRWLLQKTVEDFVLRNRATESCSDRKLCNEHGVAVRSRALIGAHLGEVMNKSSENSQAAGHSSARQLFAALLSQVLAELDGQSSPACVLSRDESKSVPGVVGWIGTPVALSELQSQIQEFEREYVSIFERHVGAVELAGVLTALERPEVQDYVVARGRIEAKLGVLVRDLRSRMHAEAT